MRSHFALYVVVGLFAVSCSGGGGSTEGGNNGNVDEPLPYWERADAACRALHGPVTAERWYWNGSEQTTDPTVTVDATFEGGELVEVDGLPCEVSDNDNFDPPACDSCRALYQCGECMVFVLVDRSINLEAHWVIEPAGFGNEAAECANLTATENYRIEDFDDAGQCLPANACEGEGFCTRGTLCIDDRCVEASCGDGRCTHGETTSSCAEDCGTGGGSCSGCLSSCRGISGCCTGCGCLCEAECGGCL